MRHAGWLIWVITLLAIAGCAGVPRGVEPVAGFDVSRYMGTWYEIARLDHRFERNLSNVTATYDLRDDGTVSVVNRGYNTKTCEWESVEGTARFLENPDTGSLSVTFFWPFSGGYNIFELDKRSYRWAAVAGPNRDYLWILARKPILPNSTKSRLISEARELGFPVDDLIKVEHGTPVCASGQ